MGASQFGPALYCSSLEFVGLAFKVPPGNPDTDFVLGNVYFFSLLVCVFDGKIWEMIACNDSQLHPHTSIGSLSK